MVTRAKKTAGTKRAVVAKRTKVVKRASEAQGKPAIAARRGTMRGMPASPRRRGRPTRMPATEEDLLRLREATETTYRKLREIDEDSLPEARREEYWRNRHIARAAWEHAENAEFENLVEHQKEQLPAVRASNAKLAKDVETTATILGVLDVVSASLGILASVISLLA
jgi:hypothetical protein